MHLRRHPAPLVLLAALAGAAIPAVAAAAAETSIHAVVEKHGDTFSVDCQLVFPVPRAIAWQVLTDFEHMPQYLGNLTESHVVRQHVEERHGNDGRDANEPEGASDVIVRQSGVARLGVFSYHFASERDVRLEAMTRIRSWQLSGNARQFTSEMVLSSDTSGSGTTHAAYHADVIPDTALGSLFGATFLQHEIEEQFSAMAREMVRRADHRGTPAAAETREGAPAAN